MRRMLKVVIKTLFTQQLLLLIKELLEEGGYDCELDELIALDWCWEGKASDTKVYLYSINLTDKPRQTPVGDGSDGEKGSYCKWESFDKIKNYRCMRINSIIFKLDRIVDIDKY